MWINNNTQYYLSYSREMHSLLYAHTVSINGKLYFHHLMLHIFWCFWPTVFWQKIEHCISSGYMSLRNGAMPCNCTRMYIQLLYIGLELQKICSFQNCYTDANNGFLHWISICNCLIYIYCECNWFDETCETITRHFWNGAKCIKWLG